MDKRWRAAHDKSGAGTTHAKIGERSVLGAGTRVAGWIPASVVGEVGWEQQLGQDGNVGNSIEASRGGVAHRRGLSAVVAAQ
jgi:hypothetical protein